MKVIVSPAKNLRSNINYVAKSPLIFEEDAKAIIKALKSLSFDELKTLYNASDAIIKEANDYIKEFNSINIFTAIHLFDGIQYKYLNSLSLYEDEINYLNNILFILSPLYGLIRPLDSIHAYRLEMHAKLIINGNKDMYSYWGNRIHDYLFKNNDTVLNLCSEEYGKSVRKYLNKEDVFIDVSFLQLVNGKYKDLGTYSKMARGMLVRYIAINKINNKEDIKSFNEDGYTYNKEFSSETHIVFTRSK